MKSRPLTPCTSKDIKKLSKVFDMQDIDVCPYCDGIFKDQPKSKTLHCPYCYRWYTTADMGDVAKRFEDFVFKGVRSG